MRVFRIYLIAATITCMVVLTGCRGISIMRDPYYPKQGDSIQFTVKVRDASDMDEATVWIGGQAYPITSSPKTIGWPTCKYSGSNYYTQLEIKGKVKYNDGEIKTTGPTILNLTTGWADYENDTRTYSIYVAHDNDGDTEDILVEAANEFIDEFDAYPLDRYEWAWPGHFNDTTAPDMIIFIGHGSHHHFKWGKGGYDSIDVSTTAFGNFAFCDLYTDVDYLIFFFSCNLLSMNDWGGHPFHWFWLNEYSTRLQKRPFMGLHQALGFRTLSVITESCFIFCSDNGDDFFNTLSDYLDAGVAVRSAWLWAIGDELDMDDNDNRGAVLFNDIYEWDSIYTAEKDDYIYGSPNYGGHFWIEYHE